MCTQCGSVALCGSSASMLDHGVIGSAITMHVVCATMHKNSTANHHHSVAMLSNNITMHYSSVQLNVCSATQGCHSNPLPLYDTVWSQH